MITYYLYYSIAIGIGQIIDAVQLHRNEGRATPMAVVFSLLEFVWAVVSMWVIWTADDTTSLPMSYPWMFIVYVAVGTVWGMFLMGPVDEDASLEDIRMPPMVAIMGGAFGAVYMLAGGYILLSR